MSSVEILRVVLTASPTSRDLLELLGGQFSEAMDFSSGRNLGT